MKTEYAPREEQRAASETCLDREEKRRQIRRRVGAYEMREAAQEHEKKAQECREQVERYFEAETCQIGVGGEVIPSSGYEDASLNDTDVQRRLASRYRLEGLADCDALTLGVDVAESIDAADTVQKLMAHELAIAHTLACRFASQATKAVEQIDCWTPVLKRNSHIADATRLGDSTARLMMAAAKATEALNKWRGGKPQQIIVQHIHMDGNSQAVISGNANTRGRDSGK